MGYAVSMSSDMKTVLIPKKLHTICADGRGCNCPIITGDKACDLVHLVNAFVTPTNPVSLTMPVKDYTDWLLYVSIASLRGR